nr:hypothetical protein [Melaminivora jejuensis]
MHIEPGVVDGAKILLSYASAAALLATTAFAGARALRQQGAACWRRCWCLAPSRYCRTTRWACPKST